MLMLSLLALPIGPVAAGSAIVPFEPETVTAPAGLDAARIDRAVVEGFVIRGWRIMEIDTRAGTIDAELPVCAHLGRVRAHIEGRKITFAYRESENIDHGWLIETRGGSKGNDGGTHFRATREGPDRCRGGAPSLPCVGERTRAHDRRHAHASGDGGGRLNVRYAVR
ncbi:MAG: hypothetical protein U5L11_05000 [Arhodomonas sp.]|nr:hypothetical protein [Arhodomonas sp.]